MTLKKLLGAALLVILLGGIRYVFDLVEKHRHPGVRGLSNNSCNIAIPPTTIAVKYPAPSSSQAFPKQFFSEHTDAIFWSLQLSRLAASDPEGFWNASDAPGGQ
jgi:hypothetical protein